MRGRSIPNRPVSMLCSRGEREKQERENEGRMMAKRKRRKKKLFICGSVLSRS